MEETGNLRRAIEAYRDSHWERIVADIGSLVAVESVEDLETAAPGVPFGPGPRAALDEALAIARRCGFQTGQSDGYIGWADLPGDTNRQLAIIGHVDVVPAGAGWHFPPYSLTRREGYLLGRGVMDDKGPLVVALHALAFWKDRGCRLPWSVRVLIGTDEETSMDDVAHYRERFADPDFLFTPDGQFPLCYGEAGICHGELVSAPIANGSILQVSAGQAANAVPGSAWAVVRGVLESDDPRITVAAIGDGCTRVEAQGSAAHASQPEEGVNAIGLLVSFLRRNAVGNAVERDFLALLERLHSAWDGSGLGIACADDHFGDLTAVGSVLALRDGRLVQTIDFRYPTAITAETIERAVGSAAQGCGAAFRLHHDKVPFLTDPASPEVQALAESYEAVTGDACQLVTSKGGTYARCFTSGVCFGPEKPWESQPDWVGGLHCADEGVSEDLLKEAFVIYALAIGAVAGI